MTRAFRLSGHRVRSMEPSRSRIEGRALIHKYIKAVFNRVTAAKIDTKSRAFALHKWAAGDGTEADARTSKR
jgi:5-carboxymethyl-2-hydroxymuconate isomerase